MPIYEQRIIHTPLSSMCFLFSSRGHVFATGSKTARVRAHVRAVRHGWGGGGWGYASHGVGWGGVGVMTFLALATLTWHAWSMLRNRWWGGVGCNSIVDLARMVDAMH